MQLLSYVASYSRSMHIVMPSACRNHALNCSDPPFKDGAVSL